MKLLTVSNTKVIKTNNSNNEYLMAILHLAPHKLSGKNVCPAASKGCIAACLNTAGFGRYSNVQHARIKRTNLFFENRSLFIELLSKDIRAFIRKAERLHRKPALRLNGTSDLSWETLTPHLFDFPIQYFDYTKIRSRMIKYLNKKMPTNYHLTFSRSENNEDICRDILNMGGNITAVFEQIPDRFWGHKVYSGDENDLRFLDKSGVIIGLIQKGRAKHDKSGFVIRG